MNLSRRVFKAGIWVSVAFAFSRLLGLIRLTILARLLLPDDFGLITIVTLVVTSIWVLSDMGAAASVIQRSRLSPVFVHTAWHINWLRGLVLAGVCWLSAPWVAMFFDHPELHSLLQWASLIPLIQGFESLGMTLLKRELEFRQRAYLDFAREIVNTSVAILLAIYWQGGAAVILWGMIAGSTVATVFSYFLHAYRPAFQFSLSAVRKIWSYGGYLMGAGILIFAMTNLDDFLVGKMLGIEQLGYYSIAFTFAGILTNQLVLVFNNVMFPAFSEIQSDDLRILRVLSLSGRLMSGVLTPVVGFVAIFPDQLVDFVFGEKWVPAASALLVLLCMGWIRGIATVFGPVLLAKGRTALIHRMKWIEFGLFISTIVPAVHYFGIVGAASVLLLVYGLSLALHMKAVSRELSGGVQKVVIQIGHGAVPGVVSFLFVLALRIFLPDVRLIVAGGVFVGVWCMLLWIRERVFVNQLVKMAMQR